MVCVGVAGSVSSLNLATSLCKEQNITLVSGSYSTFAYHEGPTAEEGAEEGAAAR